MNFWGSSYRYHKKAKKIIKLQETYRAMGDEELRQQTELFRQRLAKGESLRSLLVEAYAVVCEADFTSSPYATISCSSFGRRCNGIQ